MRPDLSAVSVELRPIVNFALKSGCWRFRRFLRLLMLTYQGIVSGKRALTALL